MLKNDKEMQMLARAADEFAKKELAPLVGDNDKHPDRGVIADLLQKAFDLDFFQTLLPEELDGMGNHRRGGPMIVGEGLGPFKGRFCPGLPGHLGYLIILGGDDHPRKNLRLQGGLDDVADQRLAKKGPDIFPGNAFASASSGNDGNVFHRLFGFRPACQIPFPAEGARFHRAPRRPPA